MTDFQRHRGDEDGNEIRNPKLTKRDKALIKYVCCARCGNKFAYASHLCLFRVFMLLISDSPSVIKYERYNARMCRPYNSASREANRREI